MTPNQYPSYLKNETGFVSSLSTGARGAGVRRVQEWVSYHGDQTVVDGDYGPATETAVKMFQKARGIKTTGTVDAATWALLVKPLHLAAANVPSPASTFDGVCLQTALQHLKLHPIEIGGENRGPWVRTYMSGKEGPEWLWCAGFVSFIMLQAGLQTSTPLPVKGSISCDTLAAQAQTAGRFITARQLSQGKVKAASLGSCFLFLVRRTSADWNHVGFGFDLQGSTFRTIEGNTNDDGGRNGFEVCSRVRSISAKDFVVLI